jgi:DNA-directed RNA polymerase subunit beta'
MSDASDINSDKLRYEHVNPALKTNTIRAVQALFPVESKDGKLKVEVANVRIDDKSFDAHGLNKWQDAREQGKTLGANILGDVTLTRDGKVAQRLSNFKLGVLPLMGALGTMMVGGNDIFTPMQLRLKPGAYTREKTNGELETFVPMKGAQLKIYMDPATGIFKIGIWSSNVRWYSIVNSLGVSDDAIVQMWGGDARAKELLEKNKTKNPDKDFEKFFRAIFEHKQNRDLLRAGVLQRDTTLDNVDAAGRVGAVKDWMSKQDVDPYVTKKTLGEEIKSLDTNLLLRASKRILGVNRGTEVADDRDSIEFKTLHHVDDMLPERITRLGRLLKRKLLLRLGKPGSTIAKGFGVNWLNPGTVGYFMGDGEIEGGLASTAEAANPLAILSEHSKVTLMGEGGIGSERAVTLDARLFRPGSANFVDAVHSPEGSQTGITTHLSWNTRKAGNKIEAMFRKVTNGKAGEPVWLTAEAANDAVVGYPEYYNDNGTPKADTVRVNKNGKVTTVPAKEVEYIIPSGRSMFDHTSNAALFLANTHPIRGMMAGKHMTQALPLVHREHPLVNLVDGKGNSVYETIAKTFVIRSRVDGTVTKVTPTAITVGNTVHELFSNYGMQAKVALDHTPVVKVGDKIKKGDLLADSNYSKDGKLALGVNVRTAYMPWKNALNYEDAIVISESAAKKFSSDHTHREEIELLPGVEVNKKLTYSQYPTLFTDASFQKLDDNGLIKVGSKVLPNDVLVAAVKKSTFDEHDRSAKNLSSIHKILMRPYKNASVVWTEIFPATVTRVVKTADKITIHLKTEEPMQVGDKLSMSSAAKGTVSAILPDDKMPRTKDGKHIEVILNPHGVVGRINPSQTIEQAAGKLVKATSKPYTFANFDGVDHATKVADALKAAGIKHDEAVYDPESGKWLEKPVAVGWNYMVKLDHPVRKKFSARERDSYTMDETPTRGKGVGGQSYDHLTTYALLGHNAHAILAEGGVRSTKNDEFWHAYQAGELPPPPKVPFVFEKFRTMLTAAGVDTQQKGTILHYLPLSEKRVKEMSNGEIEKGTLVRSKNLAVEKGGLFDVDKTGGITGDKWAHIELPERIPHPLYEKTVRDILGIKTSDYYGLIAHTKHYDPRSKKFVDTASSHTLTGEAAFEKLMDFNIDDKLKEVKTGLNTAVGSDANKLNRAARYLNGLKTTKLSAKDAYLTKFIPVLPPKYRPIIEMKGGDLRVADSNMLYRDVILTKDALNGSTGLPEDIKSEARTSLYTSVGALVGVNNPLTHREDREDAKGFADVIRGKRNKEGLFQRGLVAHRNDYTGRSTIEPDANLGVDEIGIPEEMAWRIYKPTIVRRLSQLGIKPSDAMEHVEKRTMSARQALDEEMKIRPVIYNRAPSLHRWSVASAIPRISTGKEVKISPLVVGPFNADYDGDTMAVHVPITDAARDEAFKLLPSRNLLYDKDRSVAYNVNKDIISGIFALTKPGASTGKSYSSAEEAIKAYHDNKDGLLMGTLVKIKGRPAPAAIGWLIFEEMVPPRYLGQLSAPIDGKKLDTLLTQIAEKSPSDYNAISRKIMQAGFNFAALAGGITTTVNELSIDRSKINRLLESMEKDIADAPESGKAHAAVKAYAKYNPQIEDEVKKHIGTEDRAFHSFIESKSNNKLDQIKQMLASPIMVADVHDNIVPSVIKTSYGAGMSPSDYVLATPGARKGIVARSLSTALPGSLAKEVAGNMGSIRIVEKDCGTTEGISEPLTAPAKIKDHDIDLLDRHLLRDVPGTTFKRNDPVTPEVIAKLRDKGVQNIWIRSPMTCKAKNVPCQMCAGRGPEGKLWAIGTNIGYNYGQAISERATQLTMKTFHAGGTVGAGDALMSGFNRLRELLTSPETIREQGTLSMVAGRVNSIRPAPQGGMYIDIVSGDGKTHEHHIQTGRSVKVTAGQKVEAGDELSDGNFRPDDLAALKGGLAAQRYVTDEIRKSYAAAGATVRKPVIEVLVAGLMRDVEITNDGGEADLAIGDIIHENEYNARKAKNPRITAKPSILGISQKPLQSKDLMERLNFQRLDDAIRDVPSSGGQSDLTGAKSPIPGLAYGAMFRPTQDSGFDRSVHY